MNQALDAQIRTLERERRALQDRLLQVDSQLEKLRTELDGNSAVVQAIRNVLHFPVEICLLIYQYSQRGWTQVFRQRAGALLGDVDPMCVNSDDPQADIFSILYRLEELRDSHGFFTFKLVWPLGGAADQVWKQTSNPALATCVQDYKAIHCPHKKNGWGGLALTEGNRVGEACFLAAASGSKISWFYAVGVYKLWKNGIPGPTSAEELVELWVLGDLSRHTPQITFPVPPYIDSAVRGRWLKVFNQDTQGGYFAVGSGMACNEDNPNARHFSVMRWVELFRDEKTGSFTFELRWPRSRYRNQRWSQTSNPALCRVVSGYKAIGTCYVDYGWGGLRRASGTQASAYTFMCGTQIPLKHWFYAVGSYAPWKEGIPGPGARSTRRVELWVLVPQSLQQKYD